MGMMFRTFRPHRGARSVSSWLVPGLAACVLAASASANDENAADQASAPDTMALEMPLDGDARRGRLLYLQCRACHTLEQGGENTVGPNLHGLFGSSAGVAKGFVYSEQLLASGIVWTPQTLDRWLASPSEFVPGNRMIFLGVADPKDRADLIAYVGQATASAD